MCWWLQVEHHSVITEDGYILGLHRVTNRFIGSCSAIVDEACSPIAATAGNNHDSEPETSGDCDTDHVPALLQPSQGSARPRPVVLLMHGLMQDSECFMVDSRQRGLAFWCVHCGGCSSSHPFSYFTLIPCTHSRSQRVFDSHYLSACLVCLVCWLGCGEGAIVSVFNCVISSWVPPTLHALAHAHTSDPQAVRRRV